MMYYQAIPNMPEHPPAHLALGAAILKNTAECGSWYMDDAQYEACMAQAWKNYIRCPKGLPWQ